MHKIKEFVKSHDWIYTIYFYIVSFLVNGLKLFLKTDDKLILFVSYGGRHYSESPRVMYEAMLNDNRFDDYKLVWAFVEPEKFDIKNKIKIDTLEYFKTALKARCWITNVMIERALKFRGINTYYFFTTHTILVKCDGPDIKQKKFASKAKFQYDCCLAQSEFEKKIAMRMFGLSEDKIKIVGFPKNDILVNYKEEYRYQVRKKLGISEDKKAILYAPTFREYIDLQEAFNMNVDEWKKALQDRYVLLYRAHPVVLSSVKETDSFFYDETNYEVVEDLMIASDLLISDYSGLIFDYCLMHKPIYLWTYDYDEYQKRRGLYIDLRNELPCAETEQEIIKMVATHDWNKEASDTIKLQKKYETEYGKATQKSVNLVYQNIK